MNEEGTKKEKEGKVRVFRLYVIHGTFPI